MDRKKWPARLLGLVCLLPLAVTGCRTIVPTKSAAAPNAPPTHENAARPSAPNDNAGSLVKTEFHRKVTTDQQFNVHLELGKQQMREGQYESALGEFKKSLDATTHASGLRTGTHRTEQQALAHRKIGSAMGMMGKFAEAEEHFKQAAKLTPNDPRVWNDMGYTYYSQSRWADAERCLRRASKLDPDSPLVKTNLGLAIADDGRTADALPLLSHSSGKAVGHANLGFALASQGRLVEARDEYRKALELQPQLTIAQQAIARLDNPKASEPLVNAPPLKPRLGPGVPNAGTTVVAMPAPSTLPETTGIAMPAAAPQPQPTVVSEADVTPAPVPMAAERPSDPAVSEVRLVSPAAPSTTETAPANTKLEVLPMPLAAPSPMNPTPAPAAPEVILAPPVAPTTSHTAPATAPVDTALRPTSYGAVATAAPANTTPVSPSDPIPMPVPAPAASSPVQSAAKTSLAPRASRPAQTVSRVSQASSIPMPIPAPNKARIASSSAKPVSIPMPIPVARHLAAPVSERTRNATSLPATDARLQRLPSAEY